MSESTEQTSRTVVQTYIPKYQRDEWDDHAEQLGMNRSEFIRSMVQAGRRGFTDSQVSNPTSQPTDEHIDGGDAPTSPGTPRRSTAENEANRSPLSMEEYVRSQLSRTEYLSWDELLESITTDVESKLDDTLHRLQRENVVQYSGRRGGYVLEEAMDGE